MARAKKAPTPVAIDEDEIARKDIAAYHKMREQFGGQLTDVELRQRLDALTPENKERLTIAVNALSRKFKLARARMDFSEFVKLINPDDLPGRHFDILTAAFHRIAEGEAVRLIINIAPRRGKSERSSYLFPSWFIGRFPKRKILHITNVKSLASDFGAKIRNLIDTDEYQSVFPSVKLSKDAQAKDKWRTNFKGEYYAAGVGSTVYGRGGDLCVHPDSVVVSARGKVRAKDVVVGDKLLGRGASGWEFGGVTHVINSFSDTEVVIDGILRVTPSHPVWVRGKGWVKAADVVVGDTVLKFFWPLTFFQVYLTINTCRKNLMSIFQKLVFI